MREDNNHRSHPTQKPEALLYRIMVSSTNKGDTVLDPFLGSGTTAVMAKKLQRNFIGFEQDADYIKLAKKRLKQVSLALNQDVVEIDHLQREF